MADESIPDLGKLAAEAIAKHGDEASALRALAAEGIALADEAAALKSSVTLTAAQAAEWQAYKAIGKPADIERAVKEHPALAVQHATYKREAAMRDVVEAAGVKFNVLKKLAGPDLVFETKPVKGKDGKHADVLHVRDDGGRAVPFDDYAAKHWAEFLPALKPVAPIRQPGTPSRLDPNFHLYPTAPSRNGKHTDPGTDLLNRARGSF